MRIGRGGMIDCLNVPSVKKEYIKNMLHGPTRNPA